MCRSRTEWQIQNFEIEDGKVEGMIWGDGRALSAKKIKN